MPDTVEEIKRNLQENWSGKLGSNQQANVFNTSGSPLAYSRIAWTLEFALRGGASMFATTCSEIDAGP